MDNIEISEKKTSIAGSISAAISSGLSDFVKKIKELTCGKIQLSESVKPASIKKALDWVTKHPNGGDGAAKVKTAIYICETNSLSGKSETRELTVADFLQLWANPAYSLRTEFPSIGDFFTAFLVIGGKYAAQVAGHRKIGRERTDQATEKIYEPSVRHEKDPLKLGASLLPPTIESPDREFVYNNIRMNSGSFYWIQGGTPILISRSEKTGYIDMDSKSPFWARWRDFAYGRLKEYEDRIISSAEVMQRETPMADGFPEESLDSVLMRIIPRVVLTELYLIFRYRQEEKDGPKYFDGFSVALQTGAGGPSGRMNLEEWQKRMSTNLLPSLDLAHVERMQQFSNTESEGLTYFSLDGLDVSGAEGKRRAVADEPEPPMLPAYWSHYLMGENGDFPIFEADPNMCLLRIAYFVTQLVQEDGYTRQVLFLAGGGNDGKTLFMNTLKAILGGTCSCVLNAEKLEDDSMQYRILNKTLICCPEVKQPKEFLVSSFVKKITGRDTMTLRELFHMPIEYNPEHCFLLATTNEYVSATGRAAYSRLLPVGFRINYSVKGMIGLSEMEAGLLGEKKEFLQWCFDTLAFYKTRKNSVGEALDVVQANGLRVLSDEQYASWLTGKPLIDPTLDFAGQQKAFLALQREAINSSSRFSALDNEDSEEDDASAFADLKDLLFEKEIDSSYFVKTTEIMRALIEEEKSTEVRVAGIQTAKRQYCGRYRAFIRYLKGLDGVTEERKRDKSGTMYRGFKGLKLKSNDPSLGVL